MEWSKIKKVITAGAGIMGASMAQAFAAAGYEVTIYNHRAVTLEKAKQRIALDQETLLQRGKTTPEASARLISLITYTDSDEYFKDFDILVESIVENMDIKKQFYEKVSAAAPPEAIIATNTSALPITELSRAVRHPERFLGMHWFNPPHLLPLIEVIRGEKTSDSAVQAVYGIAEHIGKKPIIVNKDVKGFVANRLQLALLREAMYIAESGVASMEDIDKTLKYALGLRYAFLGPFEVTDFGGLDTFNAIAASLFPDLCDTDRAPELLAGRVRENKLGVKTSQGFYSYSDSKAALARRDELLMKICDTLL